jgi:hypothetical protein
LSKRSRKRNGQMTKKNGQMTKKVYTNSRL